MSEGKQWLGRGGRNGLALVALVGLVASAGAQTVQPCPSPNACAELMIGSADAAPGATVSIPVSFRQGPADSAPGGIDEIAALAFTLQIGSGLRLANCSIGEDGLPAAVRPNPAISNFRVVIENASCGGGRTHCLCPESGDPDPFINVVVYGPNPLPTPGPNPVEIPVLPVGPQELFSIDLVVSSGTRGAQPLHVLTEWTDATKPAFTAFLSVGDRTAVDQTCVPVPGTPPCTATGATSQVVVVDGQVTVAGASCVGDCNGDGEVTVDEILRMVNIALGNASLGICPAADQNGDGEVIITEIIQAVSAALSGCPSS